MTTASEEHSLSIALSPELLREAREAANLSQVEAAEAAGVARGTIQNAEAGRFTPRADALARMAALYRVPMDSLFIHGPVSSKDSETRGRNGDSHSAVSTS
jgi:transcriptional regulator with XRE-family HTH domain